MARPQRARPGAYRLCSAHAIRCPISGRSTGSRILCLGAWPDITPAGVQNVHQSRASQQFREELMPDDIPADRVTAIATAARVSLAPADAERIARAVAPTVARFARAKIDRALEPEPASFGAVQRTAHVSG